MKIRYPFRKGRRLGLFLWAILFSLQNASSQTGYIYVHLKSINEENSTNFSFTLQNSLGVTTNTFSLNDEATDDNVALSGNNLFVYDQGLSHGSGGDGQLWAIAGTSFNTPEASTTLTGTVYYRNPGSSQWQQPSTAITNAKYIDGAYANQFVYINNSNNVVFWNNGTSTTIYTGGDAWDVTANGGRIAISNATKILLYSNSYSLLLGITSGGTWTTLTTPNAKSRLDMNLAASTIVYQTVGSNTVYTISTTGGTPTSLGAVGIGAAGTTDVAYDDNGIIYTCANNATYTDLIYHYSGGTWTAETQSRSLSTLTGGAGSLVYSVNEANGGAVESIFSRQTDNSGNVYWIDDERLKNSSTLNGNGIVIPVTAGTYTLTETLPTGYSLSRYNIYDPAGLTTGTVSTQVVSFNVTAGDVVFAEYVNAKLSSYTVSFTQCNSSTYLQTFDESTSSPIYVTPTYGSGTYGTPYGGTAYHYYNASSPEDGYYYLVNAESSTDWFVNTALLNDHTGNNGYFLLVNASYSQDEFYRQRLTNLTVGENYQISYWAANVNPSPPSLIFPNVKIGIQDLSGNILSSSSSGNIPSPSNPTSGTSATWYQYSLSFTATTTTVDLFLSNNNTGGYGNDLAIDDITIMLLPAATPSASGITSCSGTGTITVSSPTGSGIEYSDNGGTSYQTGTSFSSLAAGTYSITSNYTSPSTGCASTATSVVIIPITTGIFGLDKTGLVYPITATTSSGTVSAALNVSNAPSSSTTADAIGYDATNGLFYYFLKDASTFTFNSYNPSLTTSSAYTTLASPSSTGSIYIGGATADGTGYYAIDNAGALYYYKISTNTWTTITTKIVDNQSPQNNLTTQIAAGEYYGDLTEDAYGNLWFVISSATEYGLYEILAPAPTTAQASVKANQVIKYSTTNPATGYWTGIAFDATGNLFMTTSSQLWYIPITGSVTPVHITSYSGSSTSMTDLSQCNFTTNPLFVVWSSMDASLNNNNTVNVDWSVSQVSSVKGFYLERSNESQSWDTLAFVPYFNGKLSYEFTDLNPMNGINYYRIDEIDFDGNNNYSEVRFVEIAGYDNITIWPNPANDVMHILYNGTAVAVKAQLIDMFGNLVSSAELKKGDNSISLSGLPAATYFFIIYENGSLLSSKKIIKRN